MVHNFTLSFEEARKMGFDKPGVYFKSPHVTIVSKNTRVSPTKIVVEFGGKTKFAIVSKSGKIEITEA